MKRGGFKRPTLERKPVPPYTLTRPVADAVQAFVAQPKDEAHRDRKLLDLAHRVHTCQNCDCHVPEGCEPAHANGAAWGKGLARKADDWAHAALCHACHRWLDQGGAAMDPSGMYAFHLVERADMWTRAYFRTFSLYWRQRWIGIVK